MAEEYVRNMVESDYALCLRGGGNFSYRLYESLCCGRIPVIVDTDLILPFPDRIDWRSLSVWVERTDIDRIDARVASFMTVSLQKTSLHYSANAATWQRYLSPEGFFQTLCERFAR